MSVLISGPPEASRGSKVDVVRLQRCGETLLLAIGERGSELSIALVDDPQIKALNKQWRSRPRATDVLSFSQLEGVSALIFLAAVVILTVRLLRNLGLLSIETEGLTGEDPAREAGEVEGEKT